MLGEKETLAMAMCVLAETDTCPVGFYSHGYAITTSDKSLCKMKEMVKDISCEFCWLDALKNNKTFRAQDIKHFLPYEFKPCLSSLK